MANAKAKLYYTTPEYIDTLPVKNGNIIFVPAMNKVCLDMADQRFEYETIKTFQTDEERADVPFPNEGFYYVEQDAMIWRYSRGHWRQLTPTNLRPIVYGDCEEDFPELGANDTLYYTDEGIYN